MLSQGKTPWTDPRGSFQLLWETPLKFQFTGKMPPKKLERPQGVFSWNIIDGSYCTYLPAFSNLKLTPSAIDKSTPIHLYVEDKDHPLKNSGYEFLQVVQSKTFIIPCMPTHPDVIVSLWKQGRRIEAGDQYITFDPKVITYFLFKIWHVWIWLGYTKISREILRA